MGQCQTLHSISTLLWIQDIQREERGEPWPPHSPLGAELPAAAVQGQLWLKLRVKLPPQWGRQQEQGAGLAAQGAVRTTNSLCSAGGKG